jgi:hypothetical protein
VQYSAVECKLYGKSPRKDSKSSSALSMRSAYSPIIQIMLALAWEE